MGFGLWFIEGSKWKAGQRDSWGPYSQMKGESVIFNIIKSTERVVFRFVYIIISSIVFVSEPEKSNHDNKSLGGTGILWLLCSIMINICTL